MPRYRWVGETRVQFPTVGVEVDPGEEFDSDEELNHPLLEKVKKTSTKADTSASKED